MGLTAYGSDIEPRMIEMSKTNLKWLNTQYPILNTQYTLEAADARNHSWQPPIDAVVSETYLGPPQLSAPDRAKLSILSDENGQLVGTFLKNLRSQIKSGTRLCLALPAWQHGPQDVRSTVVDQIEALGYTRPVLRSAGARNLIYRRPDQIVGRELLVLRKS